MYEHAVYSVISPEGAPQFLAFCRTCQNPAEALRLTADDMAKLGVIDAVVQEPLGAARNDPIKANDLATR